MAVRGHDDEVLDPHPEVAGQVDAGLDRHDVPGGELAVSVGGEAWLLVDLEADAVAEAVAEVVAVARLFDQRPRDRVDRPCTRLPA